MSPSRKKNSGGHLAVAAHQPGVHVHTAVPELRMIGGRVGRLEGDAGHPPGLVVGLGTNEGVIAAACREYAETRVVS